MNDEIKNRISDAIEGGAIGLVSNVPYVGPIFSAVVTSINEGIYKRRLNEWMKFVEDEISSLEEDDRLNLEANDAFATMLLKASQMAIATNEEKMKYLANGLKYVAENPIDDAELIIFLNCIEKYTMLHIHLLHFCSNPRAYFKNTTPFFSTSSINNFFSQYCELKSLKFNADLKYIAVRDLNRDGLLAVDSISINSSEDSCLNRHTTDLGEKFVKFYGI